MVRLPSVNVDTADRRSPARRDDLGSILDGLRRGPSRAKGRHDHHNAIYRAWRYSRDCCTCSIGCWLFLVHHSCSGYGRLWSGRRVPCCIHCRESFFPSRGISIYLTVYRRSRGFVQKAPRLFLHDDDHRLPNHWTAPHTDRLSQ